MEHIDQLFDKFGKDLRYYGILKSSDKYTQGIDVSIYLSHQPQEPFNGPAVYFLSYQGMLHKIGQTANLHNRMFRQYKCISNATNNRIRDYIKSGHPLQVHYIPLKEHEINKFGYDLKTSYSSALEHQLLKEYKQIYDKLPDLNTMIK